MANFTGRSKPIQYLFQNGGGGASDLADLGDVNLTTPTDGQVLAYDANADEWVNSSTANPSSIASMSDTDIQSPTNGQTLVYNSTSAKWENASGGTSGHTYSTTEQVVGTWIDGKPLYETTINTGALPNSAWSTISHGILDIEKIISMAGYAYRSTNGTCIPLPYVGTGEVCLNASPTAVAIQTTSNRSDFTESYVTIRYTKTTD